MPTIKDTKFETLIGHDKIKTSLTKVIEQELVAPAYLFVGRDGVGKTLTAQLFAQSLLRATSSNLINHPDYLEVEPTTLHEGQMLTEKEVQDKGVEFKNPVIRVEQVRNLMSFIGKAPIKSERKVVIIKDVDRMPTISANAFLKTLEEPERSTIILVSSNEEVILPTIKSRCSVLPFKPLSLKQVELVLNSTNTDIYEYKEVLDFADGSPGAALKAINHLKIINNAFETNYSYFPKTVWECLHFAEQASNLPKLTQLWLLKYLSYQFYKSKKFTSALQNIDKAYRHLQLNVKPLLVWNVLLLSFIQNENKA